MAEIIKNTSSSTTSLDSKAKTDEELINTNEEEEEDEEELPSIEERKIFLTCLACILTSTYKYDVIEEDALSIDNTNNNNTISGSNNAEVHGLTHDDISAEDHDDDDDDDDISEEDDDVDDQLELDISDEDDTTTTTNNNNNNNHTVAQNNDNNKKKEVSMFAEEEEEEISEIGGVDVSDLAAAPPNNIADSSKHNPEKDKHESATNIPSIIAGGTGGGGGGGGGRVGVAGRWRRRFGRDKNKNNKNNNHNNKAEDSVTFSSAMSMSETNCGGGSDDNPNGPSQRQISSPISLSSPSQSEQQQSQQQQRRKRVSRAQKKLQLAAKRHYNRRYIVADQLLQSSCDHLLLDQVLSEAVYTQLKTRLEPLKSPKIVPASNNNNNNNINNKNIRRNLWSISHSDDNDSSDNSEENATVAENKIENDAGEGEVAVEKVNGNSNNSNSNNNNDDDDDDDDGPTDDDSEDADEKEDQRARKRQMQQQHLKQNEWMTEYDEQLAEYLPRLSPGVGYRCICWLIFQHLLNASKRGYDARARYVFKTIAVAVLVQDIERTLNYSAPAEEQEEEGKLNYDEWKLKNYTTWVSFATRKFEQIEAAMADRLLKLAQQSDNKQDPYENGGGAQSPAVSLEELDDAQDEVQVVTVKKNKNKLAGARKHLVRGLKIGGVGVVAGTLLAVTGGMAAPAIAGALTFLGLSTVAGTFLTLASSTAVVHIFGVAGGSLAAYKMRRRTAGLTEFTIVQSLTTASSKQNEESNDNDLLPGEKDQSKPRLARWREKAKQFKERRTNPNKNELPTNVELSRTICISGWLTDKCDFQRPWGVTPTQPVASKLEKLQRFYSVYNPDLIPVCNNLLKRWKKELSTFFDLLEDKYGCNPDTLFPLKFGPMHDAALTEVEVFVLDKLILEIGEERGKKKEAANADLPEHVQSAASLQPKEMTNDVDAFESPVFTSAADDDSVIVVEESEFSDQKEDDLDSHRFQRQCYASVFEQVAPSSSLEKLIPPEHLATVWDFSSRYGGEVYTLHWESVMLLKLSQCFRDVAFSATASASQQALRLMVANTVALAASIPIYILQAMNTIDETWSVVVSRAEEAGKELARSLLINEAGHRPVTLVAYSFGARVVFSCLKQLAVYQQQWEEYHEQKHSRAIGFAHHDEEGRSPSRRQKKWMLHELEFEKEPASVVEDVILMGAPMYLSLSSWKACRQVVAGRFVNVYSRTDRILSLMFKYKQMMESFKPVCGNCTVAVPGVENIDISDLVSNHQEYALKIGDILKRVRHGQPIRSSTNALDEVALIEEAKTLAKQQEKSGTVEESIESTSLVKHREKS